MLKVYNFVFFRENHISFGIKIRDVSVNNPVKFQVKIPNGC